MFALLQPRAQKKTANTRREIVRRGGVGTTFSVASCELFTIALSRCRPGERHPHNVGRRRRHYFLRTHSDTMPTVPRRSASRFPLAPSGECRFFLRDPSRSNTAHTRRTESTIGDCSPTHGRRKRHKERGSRAFESSALHASITKPTNPRTRLPEMYALVIIFAGGRLVSRR